MALKPYDMKEKRDSETLRLLTEIHAALRCTASDRAEEWLSDKKKIFDGLNVLIQDAEKKLEGFLPLPFGWRWYVDITPIVKHEIILNNGNRERGSFQPESFGGCFIVGSLVRSDRVVKFQDIAYYRRIL